MNQLALLLESAPTVELRSFDIDLLGAEDIVI